MCIIIFSARTFLFRFFISGQAWTLWWIFSHFIFYFLDQFLGFMQPTFVLSASSLFLSARDLSLFFFDFCLVIWGSFGLNYLIFGTGIAVEFPLVLNIFTVLRILLLCQKWPAEFFTKQFQLLVQIGILQTFLGFLELLLFLGFLSFQPDCVLSICLIFSVDLVGHISTGSTGWYTRSASSILH